MIWDWPAILACGGFGALVGVIVLWAVAWALGEVG